MALFDDVMFDSQNYGGLLGDLLRKVQQGGLPIMPSPGPVAGFQDQDNAQLPQNAQPTAGAMPQMQPQAAPQAPQQQQTPFFGQGGALQNKLYELAGILNPNMAHLSQRNQQQQALQASYQALRSAGVPDAMAQAAALNPEILKMVAGNYFDTKPQFGVIGQNRYGQNQYGFINPAQRSVTPAQMAGGQQASVPDNSNLTGQDYLNTLDKDEQNIIKGMLEGRMQPPSSFALKSPLWSKRLEDAATVEPGFDMTKWTARVAGNKDFYGGGKSSEMVRAANQTIHHVGALIDSMDALHNTQYPQYNAVGNFVNKEILGKGAVTEFLPNAHAVAEEMSKVFKGANLSDAEIRQWESSLNQNMSPEQQRAAVGKLMVLLNGSLEALENKRKMSLGDELSAQKGPLLDDKSRETMAKVNKWIAGQRYQPAPQSSTNSNLPAPPAGFRIQ